MISEQGFVSSSSVEVSGAVGREEPHSSSLLYSLSLLKEKVHQVQGLVGIIISSDHHQQQQPESTSIAMAMANMGSLFQEIILTTSTILFTCQQMTTSTTHVNKVAENDDRGGLSTTSRQPHFDGNNNIGQEERALGFYSGEAFEILYGENNYNCNTNTSSGIRVLEGSSELGANNASSKNCDIIELDAANLLAKYTHYCQVCGKGFKRDANLRMHMRAHGDEYKTSAALTNPLKKNYNKELSAAMKLPRKLYSCPQEGCRWNQKHAKFQPLKSMICAKNHYKRSHCPKMYVCKRCNRKQFSVLSDLRTHEKHCGDLKWQCSCGTTFSRKDKLMGHVALFVGHTPVVVVHSTSTKPKVEINQAALMQLDERG